MGKNRSQARRNERKTRADARHTTPEPGISRNWQRRDKRFEEKSPPVRPKQRIMSTLDGHPERCVDCGSEKLIGFNCGSPQCRTNKDESIFHEEV